MKVRGKIVYYYLFLILLFSIGIVLFYFGYFYNIIHFQNKTKSFFYIIHNLGTERKNNFSSIFHYIYFLKYGFVAQLLLALSIAILSFCCLFILLRFTIVFLALEIKYKLSSTSSKNKITDSPNSNNFPLSNSLVSNSSLNRHLSTTHYKKKRKEEN